MAAEWFPSARSGLASADSSDTKDSLFSSIGHESVAPDYDNVRGHSIRSISKIIRHLLHVHYPIHCPVEL